MEELVFEQEPLSKAMDEMEAEELLFREVLELVILSTRNRIQSNFACTLLLPPSDQ